MPRYHCGRVIGGRIVIGGRRFRSHRVEENVKPVERRRRRQEPAAEHPVVHPGGGEHGCKCGVVVRGYGELHTVAAAAKRVVDVPTIASHLRVAKRAVGRVVGAPVAPAPVDLMQQPVGAGAARSRPGRTPARATRCRQSTQSARRWRRFPGVRPPPQPRAPHPPTAGA